MNSTCLSISWLRGWSPWQPVAWLMSYRKLQNQQHVIYRIQTACCALPSNKAASIILFFHLTPLSSHQHSAKVQGQFYLIVPFQSCCLEIHFSLQHTFQSNLESVLQPKALKISQGENYLVIYVKGTFRLIQNRWCKFCFVWLHWLLYKLWQFGN